MRLAPILIMASVLVATVAGPAAAQSYITPFFGYNFGGDSLTCVSFSNCDEKHTNIGVAIGSTGKFAGSEQDISYVPHFFGDTPDVGNSMLTAMTNFLVILPAGPVHPYGVVGIGLMRAHAPTGTKNALAWDIGGGANIFFTKRLGLRGDVRRIRSMQNITLFVLSGAKLEFWRATIGVTFR